VGAGRPHSAIALLAGGAALAAAFSIRQAQGAEFELKPTLSVSEQYDDNIFESVDGRRSEFTTRVLPAAALRYRTPALTLDGSYLFEYRNYAKGTHDDEEIHNVNLKGNVELVDHLLYLDIGESLHRTAVNVARDLANESLLVNQTNQNIASVSPYLVWRPGERATLKSGYRYTDTRYYEGAGFDKREHGAFLDLSHEPSSKLTLTASYAFDRAETDPVSYDSHSLSGGFKYAYAENCSLFGRVGNNWQNFSGGIHAGNLFWDAGVSHDFGLAVLLLETQVQNAEDPLSVSTRQVSYTGRIEKPLQRGSVSASGGYSEYYVVQTGALEQKKGMAVVTGRYEFLPRLSASASALFEHFSKETASDYPYRLTGNAALSYGFYNDDTSLTLAYTYVNDRFQLGSGRGEKSSNRVVVEVRTGF
jgi:hypothetical protein